MSEDSRLSEGARKIVANRNREHGEGRTSKFIINFDFPSIVTLEEVAGGLFGDISGREDIEARVDKASEDASVELLYAHHKRVLSSRLFRLVAKAVPRLLNGSFDKSKITELNALLGLMAELQPTVIYEEHEAIRTKKAINLLTGSELTTEDVLNNAIHVLQGACRKIPQNFDNPVRYKLEGLVPLRVDRGIALEFVPVHEVDYY